jgi:hypothetical protein
LTTWKAPLKQNKSGTIADLNASPRPAFTTGALHGTYRTTSPSLNPLDIFSDNASDNLSIIFNKNLFFNLQKQEQAVF